MADWKWFALASAVFAGLTAVLSKVGVRNVPSSWATLFRTFVVLVFLSGLVWARHEWRNPSSLAGRSLLFLALSGLATGFSWLCYYRALQTGPASLVAPLDKLSLLFAVLLSVFFLGERLGPAQWLGVGMMTGGALMVALR